MHILIVSATQFEVKPLLDHLQINDPVTGMNKSGKAFNGKCMDVLITGVGMVNTALMIGRHLTDSYHMVINVGVCGAFTKNLEPGQVVRVTEDVLSEMGAEDGTEFLTYDTLNLPGEHVFSECNDTSYAMVELLQKVKGITVNTVHGNELSIGKINALYHADVESMEGAAFFAACKGISGNYIQLRTISNYVERRDKSKWQMPLAIKNLNDFLIAFIKNA